MKRNLADPSIGASTLPESAATDDIEAVTDHLANRVGDESPRDALQARVRRNFTVFQEAAVRQFVPVFVERRVRAELLALTPVALK